MGHSIFPPTRANSVYGRLSHIAFQRAFVFWFPEGLVNGFEPNLGPMVAFFFGGLLVDFINSSLSPTAHLLHYAPAPHCHPTLHNPPHSTSSLSMAYRERLTHHALSFLI